MRNITQLHAVILADDGLETDVYWNVSGNGRPYADAINEMLDHYRTIESEKVIFVEALKSDENPSRIANAGRSPIGY